MTQLAYKKDDLYQDVRACIREGMSVKETADLCGCKESIVYKWTDDIRTKRKTPVFVNDQELEQIKIDYEESKKKLTDIALEHGLADYRAVIKLANNHGWKKRRPYRKGEEEMNGGAVSKSIDIHEIEMNAKKYHEKDDQQEITIDSLKREDDEKKKGDMFKNLQLFFDGNYGSYRVKPGEKIRAEIHCEANGTTGVITINMEDLKGIANEFLEISKQFGGAKK